MVSWQAFPSLPPRAPLALLSHLKLPFPSLSNACHAGYVCAFSIFSGPDYLGAWNRLRAYNRKFTALASLSGDEIAGGEVGARGGTWVFFGWVCAAQDYKLAPRSKKNSPKIDTPF